MAITQQSNLWRVAWSLLDARVLHCQRGDDIEQLVNLNFEFIVKLIDVKKEFLAFDQIDCCLTHNKFTLKITWYY